VADIREQSALLYARTLGLLVRLALAGLCASYLAYLFFSPAVPPEAIAALWPLPAGEFERAMEILRSGGQNWADRTPSIWIYAVGSVSPLCMAVLAAHYLRRGEKLQGKLAAALVLVFLFAMSGMANSL
jgi:hypothetical protein